MTGGLEQRWNFLAKVQRPTNTATEWTDSLNNYQLPTTNITHIPTWQSTKLQNIFIIWLSAVVWCGCDCYSSRCFVQSRGITFRWRHTIKPFEMYSKQHFNRTVHHKPSRRRKCLANVRLFGSHSKSLVMCVMKSAALHVCNAECRVYATCRLYGLWS